MKVVRDGKVAVLVSPGYGAGWSTWNPSEPQCLFDPDVVAWVMGGKQGGLPDLKVKYGVDYFCSLGSTSLDIEWVPVGAKFRIQEYDGFEALILETEQEWLVA